jgi:hypothetical protein
MRLCDQQSKLPEVDSGAFAHVVPCEYSRPEHLVPEKIDRSTSHCGRRGTKGEGRRPRAGMSEQGCQ